ncbi:hypothetical protein SBDP1_1580013 [Syntrophobacter sp. SbD1]|nr:hypothetical protein SBDP1_1580013 [Syntrophobacter sp. SbD1]
MISLRALRVSFVLFVTQKAFDSKVNSIGSDLRPPPTHKSCNVSVACNTHFCPARDPHTTASRHKPP